jgi:protein arginine N-methyltransferase 3
MPRDYSDSESDSGSSVGSIVEERSEADETTFKCLFCDKQFARVPDMSSHCTSEHGFDLNATVKSLGSSEPYRTMPIWDTTNILQRRMRSISSSW